MNMVQIEDVLLLMLLSLNIVFFFIGYLIGKNQKTYILQNQDISDVAVRQKKNSTKKTDKITIDETKIVSKINTKDLEKKYDKLGDTKETKDTINTSVDKLKSMKG